MTSIKIKPMQKALFLLTFLLCSCHLFSADTKHIEMDYGNTLFMSLETQWPESENIVRKALVQKLNTKALPEKGTPIGKGRVIKVKDPIENTELDPIYQYQRERSTGYLIALPKGSYKVTLKFAEIKRKSEGERVFDILLQKNLIKSNFDPLKETGGQFKAIDITVDNVDVTNFLRLEFTQKSTRSSPAIAGIIIENDSFKKRINCGGDAQLDYEADWDKYDYMEDPFSTGIIFDTELLKYSTAWLNGFVKLKGTAYDATHGTHPEIQGAQVWGSGFLPGWVPENKSKSDPRAEHLGHLPKDWAHYKGVYRHEEGNIIQYQVQGTQVLDKMELLKVPATTVGQAYLRTIQTAPLKESQECLLLEVEADDLKIEKDGQKFITSNGFSFILKGLTTESLSTHTRTLNEKTLTAIYLKLPKGQHHFTVATLYSEEAEGHTVLEKAFQSYQTPNLKAYLQGGKLRWPGTITTKGTTGENKGSFTIDEITLPENNPWRSWMRPGAFDFTADGQSLYVSTWSGDVWKATNLNNLNNLVWKRFAAGLFHPLGLKVVDGKVYVQCRDQIAILHDLNQDGEADYYQNFNNDVVITENFHEFSFELHRDKEGNFYFIKGAPVVAGGEGFGDIKVHHGKLFKVSPDGSKLEVIASGFRAPNGLGISPKGQLSSSDNEGNWVAATPINWIQENGFYGVQPTYAGESAPSKRSPIVCWIPHKVDNSAGGQVWVPEGEWGPYGGEMFHISYGQTKLFHVLKEEIHGQIQGGVVDIQPTGDFEAGIMRGRFNTSDKAIYLCGLKGWQTKGVKDGGLYRVRYTHENSCQPIGLKVAKNGISIEFTDKVKAESALDAGNYDISRWVYEISDKYGSKHYKVPEGRLWDSHSQWSPLPQSELDKFNQLSFPDEEAKKTALTQLYDKYIGEDQVTINSISISEDGKKVFLEIPDIAPVMQMRVSFNIESHKNTKVKHDIYHTIHKLGDWKGIPGKKILTKDLSEPQSGLIASFKHLGQNKTDTRIQRMAAFHIEEKNPITQFLDHGPFQTQLNGFVKVERNMSVTLSLVGTGISTLSINGALVCRDQDLNSKNQFSVDFKKGFNKLNLTYSSPKVGPATLRLYWEALDYFPKEPIPAKVLFHEPTSEALKQSLLKRKGLALTIENNCFSCHQTGSSIELPELQQHKISLNDLGSRLNSAWVAQWLKNPKNLRHNAKMPVMLKNLPESQWEQAASDLSAYLHSFNSTSSHEPLEGSTEQGKTSFQNLGCASCHHMEDQNESEHSISLKYLGFKFQHGKIKDFLLSPQTHNPSIKMPNFKLSEEEAQNLEVYLRTKTKPIDSKVVSGDLHKGKAYFEQLNCAACHDLDKHQPQKLESIFSKSSGCLTSGGKGKPYYDLAQNDREALSVFLAEGHEALKHNDPIEYSDRSILAYQCLNCHTRDEKASGWKSPHTLPSELPPSLTHTGEKLSVEFLQSIFKGDLNQKMRPWMKAKMPYFSLDTENLASGLAASHGFSKSTSQPPQKNGAIGAELILQNGFACIVCHDTGSLKALAPFGAPGPNLELAGERLRHEYYLRWMLNPQRVEPSTHMTKFSSDHQTTGVKVLDGDAHEQFNAIWNHLLERQK